MGLAHVQDAPEGILCGPRATAGVGALHVGTSGYSYQHWKEIFYPKGLGQARWLEYYAQHFNALEINATFYRSFARSVYEKWHDRTPPGFAFVLKGPKTVTRTKRLVDVDAELDAFFEAAAGLKDKLSAVLWQLPPSFKNDEKSFETMRAFLNRLPSSIRQAVELRHRSWCTEEFVDLLNTHRVGWVSADSSRFVSFECNVGGFAYYRFHGPRQLYASSYSAEDLTEWARRIRDALSGGDAYCFFNNDFHGYALRDADALREILRGSGGDEVMG